MHIVFGGLFNGKRQYVKVHLKPTIVIDSDIQSLNVSDQIVSIENFPQLVLPYVVYDEVIASDIVFTYIQQIAKSNVVICVCDDISRGVVPMDATERKTRDILGRLYQQLFIEAKTITRIWYGIPETLK